MAVPVSGPASWVGIDVSKARLDVALLPDATTFRVTNTQPGWNRLVAQVRRVAPAGIVLEATGRYHRG